MGLAKDAFMSSARSSLFRSKCRDFESLGKSEAAPVRGQNVTADEGSLENIILDGEVPVRQCVWVL